MCGELAVGEKLKRERGGCRAEEVEGIGLCVLEREKRERESGGKVKSKKD